MTSKNNDEPLLDESEEGAYSFAPGFTRDELRRAISGREFQALQQFLREERRPAQWRASLICSIHREIFGEVFPQTAGRFRTAETLHGRRAAAPVEHVDVLMQQLILAIKQDLAHAIKLSVGSNDYIEHVFLSAARHHAQMIHIHPFVDGNGRWARFVTNIYLNDTGLGCGTVIYARDRKVYIDAIDRILENSEPGDLANLFIEGYVDQAERRFSGNRPRTE